MSHESAPSCRATRIINLRDAAAVAAAQADGTRAEVIRRYADYLLTRPDLLADLPSLRGHTLACWCAPAPCHAEVLRDFAESGAPGTDT